MSWPARPLAPPLLRRPARSATLSPRPPPRPRTPIAIDRRQDQWAIGHRTANYVSATFAVDALVGELRTHLDQAGYTQYIHSALRALEAYCLLPRELAQDAVVFLRNTCVLPNTAEDQRARKAARTAAAAAGSSAASSSEGPRAP